MLRRVLVLSVVLVSGFRIPPDAAVWSPPTSETDGNGDQLIRVHGGVRWVDAPPIPLPLKFTDWVAVPLIPLPL